MLSVIPLRLPLVVAAALVLGSFVGPATAADGSRTHPWRNPTLSRPDNTRTWVIRYRAHTGRTRLAYVLLPRWYGPRVHPAIPLVISPHGRGTDGLLNSKLWGDLPATGRFAVVNPDGEGDRLGRHSWGAPGQIEDLARMPDAVRRALPWLRLRRSSVYAVGGSMGGQETLLLLAKHPRLLAGAAAFDAVVDFAHQYRQFSRLDCNHTCRERLGEPFGRYLQRLARAEVGGDPARVAGAYAARSPIAYASAIARSCVPLQLWWSRADRIVVDPDRQSAHMLALLRRLNPAAPVEGIEGAWAHSAEMVARTRLPFALARLGLLPATFDGTWGLDGATYSPPPEPSCTRR